MKTGKFTLLAATVAIAWAQGQRPAGEITIKPVIHEAKYCLGPTSYVPIKGQPDKSDITLRLSLKLLYDNHRAEPVILPLGFRSRIQVIVPGQREAQSVVSRESILDQRFIVTLARPEPPDFVVIAAGVTELWYLGDGFDVPVHSSSRQLLGKTVQFTITRDHGLQAPADIVAQLQTKWRAYGKLWTGIQDSETVSVAIPASPQTVDCRPDDKF